MYVDGLMDDDGEAGSIVLQGLSGSMAYVYSPLTWTGLMDTTTEGSEAGGG
jgi:hypothetical protein